ncbi:hypothetical protein OF829_11510 [Sphingomonas sp. LB-2]|uniref:hypothetical protein n=1 Tax=Sphingomonas caeni TaxID=2984949 RepID=UPI00222FB990|nr:hypothetical protein [Sphingomonas caeni]MCW3847868.1 hypothetical protein [Sphingomonas caeni]
MKVINSPMVVGRGASSISSDVRKRLEEFMVILAAIGLTATVVLLATFVIGLIKVMIDGRRGVDLFDRAGFGAEAYWLAKLPRQSASSSVATREGILASGRRGAGIQLRQTRTISHELL